MSEVSASNDGFFGFMASKMRYNVFSIIECYVFLRQLRYEDTAPSDLFFDFDFHGREELIHAIH